MSVGASSPDVALRWLEQAEDYYTLIGDYYDLKSNMYLRDL